MVGLSDIPVVGKAVEMISEATVQAAYRGLRYMFCCKDLVNVLNSEIEKINIQENVVSKKVVDENESGKIVEDHVYKWQEQVKEIQEDSKKISEKYKNRRPIPNPLSRFRLGREAVQKANKVAELMEAGRELLTNPIACLPPVENLPKTDSVFQDFASRKVAYDKIWHSLITEGSPRILGIYGLPGVGKTRIAEQLWKEAKEKGIFNKVTKAVVSGEKDLDVKRLQNELARDLNCHFESQDDIKHRASQLERSIMYGDKVLVILDDVWREIPLHDIGIPIGDVGSDRYIFSSLTRWISLSGNQVEAAAFVSLIERAEGVGSDSTDVDVSSIFNSNRQAFSDLKDLAIDGSDTMEHLARIQPHHQIQPPTSFSQLTELNISDCSKMKYLFCNSVAKCLVQLQYLRVWNCSVMEAIIVNEGSRTDGQEEEEDIS